MTFFTEIEKKKSLNIHETNTLIFKELLLKTFKLYYRSTVIKQCGADTKTGVCTNGTKQNIQTQAHTTAAI